jgi:multiple sugar transport system permease protein
MTMHTRVPPTATRLGRADSAFREWVDRETNLGYLLVIPACLILFLFVAYPFVLGIWFSMSDNVPGQEGHFVGLRNFIALLSDATFLQTAGNTFVYTVTTITFKTVLGMALALLMNQTFPFRNLVRSLLLLPWIVPTALSTLAWLWIFDPTFSVFNWLMLHLGIGSKINWLGAPDLAMLSIIIVNVWRGIPFFAISLLAGLQSVPLELYEAASMDGASAIRRFWNVTLPLVRPVLMLVVLFATIWTIGDFQLVYILTRGGPMNSTHLLGTYAYQIALTAGRLGEGAAVSLYMLPLLLAVIAVMLWQIRRD